MTTFLENVKNLHLYILTQMIIVYCFLPNAVTKMHLIKGWTLKRNKILLLMNYTFGKVIKMSTMLRV